ncbi:MAG: pyridine nucleotide-disulfide oxidoreductase [Candidatus Lambdaproteobacteria bacterium RIFOXYD2_FULL_50_16]|uniref:Pyridine nucleotide-disulfide oxidoreductase n=1 Tax=Candidatus Lambdaproteobacteria bacterium RIFOXYD2_FULL_50_16 TaxID=1817772 RepID=A0A1F6G5B1_9PROT|nr:MAG: pyridine nucleotide-disulfide oxidoreductase [Candidatus Lambdaproteobacteria bacterium RIFOXYD2_FULL_50_16]
MPILSKKTGQGLKLALFFGLVGLGVLVWFFGLGDYLNLGWLKDQQTRFVDLYEQFPVIVLASYFLIYLAFTGLNFPSSTLLTLLAGALFGFIPGLILVSFASSLGALTAFGISRFLLKDSVEARFGAKLEKINQGLSEDGVFYLLSLRLIPVIPFFMVNSLMGLTGIRAWTFYWASQLGMIPGTAVYVYAGLELSRLEGLSGIVEPRLWIAFSLLGLFPWFARWLIRQIKTWRLYRSFDRPKHFDYNLIVVGAGAGGLVSAYIGQAVGAKVALIEGAQMGGDCLNHGCVPSKSLINTAKLLRLAGRSKEFGINKMDAQFDFAQVMDSVKNAIASIEPHDSAQRYKSMGVDCIQGWAQVLDPFRVQVNGQVLTGRHLILATGAKPRIPELPGIEEIDYLTSDSLWEIRELPKRLLILGGGPIACELAQAFNSLGSKVILVNRSPRLLAKEEPAVSELIKTIFLSQGIELHLGVKTLAFTPNLQVEGPSGEYEIPFDRLLLALGRNPIGAGMGLEKLGLLGKNGNIDSDPYLRTRFPNILVVGDQVGGPQFTHAAAHQAWHAAVNALFSPWKAFKVDYSYLPRVTFTDPQVAQVGATFDQAPGAEVTRYNLVELDRALIERETEGFVQVLTQPGTDKILGVTLVGAQAGEMIHQWTLALKEGIGLNKILAQIHPYPTWGEANKAVAGVWKKAHSPKRVLLWLTHYFTWLRQ